MLPVIALVGRPNVGKSTLFNRMTHSRNAIVANFSGLTRDRQYGECQFDDSHRFIVIDTGGLGEEDQGIDALMAEQSLQAIKEADLVFLLVDCRAGLTVGDHAIARYLRQHDKNTVLVVNKSDGLDPDIAMSDFFSLGIQKIFPIAAVHGRGVHALLEAAILSLPHASATESDNEIESFPTEVAEITEQPDSVQSVKIAVVGRPNVGKSTLVNRMLGEERVIVFDMPGTTRDSIYIDYERDNERYTLIDTAGIRKRKNIIEAIEKFSIVKTLQAIEDANVVVLVMDAHEGIVDQDLHLLGHVIEKGRALVVAINKWDGLDSYKREEIRRTLDRRLQFASFADTHFISALHGSGVGNLYGSINKAYLSATKKLGTHFLTEVLEQAVAQHQPPMVNGRRIKLRYAHAGGQNPPIIIIHGNQVDQVPEHYKRYLEKAFRSALQLAGTPVRIEFRGGDNPFEGRRNTLTARQLHKRKRLVRHIKKREK